MASVATDKSGNRLIRFRYGTREFTKSANTRDQNEAEVVKALVEDTRMRLRRG